MPEVILFTQPDCPPCKILKLFLQENQIGYVEKNIRQDSAARNDLTSKYGSFSTPTVVINDQVIIGFEPDRIKEALEIQ